VYAQLHCGHAGKLLIGGSRLFKGWQIIPSFCPLRNRLRALIFLRAAADGQSTHIAAGIPLGTFRSVCGIFARRPNFRGAWGILGENSTALSGTTRWK